MTDPSTESAEARSAGSMLRAARERQGLHIAALAAAIKVPPAKLDALECARYDELTDITFARALAQSVCRVLKIDAKPVLDLLPNAPDTILAKAEKRHAAPFRERPGRTEPDDARPWHHPVFWIVMLLLGAAAAFLLWPGRAALTSPEAAASAPAATLPEPAASQGQASVAAPPPGDATAGRAEASPAAASAAAPIEASSPAVVTETVHSAPAGSTADAAREAPSGLLVVRAREPSWVEVEDAKGVVMLSRTLQPGESVGLDGALPLRMIIGNANATEVTMRGKRVPIVATTRDNVVRLELK
jgi:cytoskeleton protein RodZ